MGAVAVGLSAGARHEHRQHVRRVRAVLDGVRLGHLAGHVVTAAWLALASATLLGASAPAVRTVLPQDMATIVPVALLLVLAGTAGGLLRHGRQATSTHHVLLGALPPATRAGVLAGLGVTYVPAVVVVCNQVLRGGLSGWADAAAAVLRASSQWVERAGSEWLVRGAGALGVVLTSAVVTGCASHWISRNGLGPRVPSAHRWAGRAVLVWLSCGWLAAALLDSNAGLDVVGQHVLLAAAFAVTLLLRARHVRFMSPESLGHGLLLAARTGGDPRRIVGVFHRNSVLLLAPVHLGAAALLFLHDSGPAVVLLLSLAVLELALSSILVQRTTVVLPASASSLLVVESRSALGAAMCLAVVFATTGVAGLSSALDLAHHHTTVWGASALLVLATLAIAWIVRIDTARWLTELRATTRSAP